MGFRLTGEELEPDDEWKEKIEVKKLEDWVRFKNKAKQI